MGVFLGTRTDMLWKEGHVCRDAQVTVGDIVRHVKGDA